MFYFDDHYSEVGMRAQRYTRPCTQTQAYSWTLTRREKHAHTKAKEIRRCHVGLEILFLAWRCLPMLERHQFESLAIALYITVNVSLYIPPLSLSNTLMRPIRLTIRRLTRGAWKQTLRQKVIYRTRKLASSLSYLVPKSCGFILIGNIHPPLPDSRQ